MGRKSALTPEEWAIIERRVLVDGETVNSIAKELGINESTVRRKIKPNKAEQAQKPGKAKSLMQLATEKVSAEQAVKDIAEQVAILPMSRQLIVNELSRKLSSISEHLASAAEYGAMNAHRLAMIANQQIDLLDETVPLEENAEALKSILTFQRGANFSAETGLNLLHANKDYNALTDEQIASMSIEQIEERLSKG